MIVDSTAADIIYSNYFTGNSRQLPEGVDHSDGHDPNALPEADPSKMDFDKATTGAKAWKEIWGAGQGVGAIKAIEPVEKARRTGWREIFAGRERLGLSPTRLFEEKRQDRENRLEIGFGCLYRASLADWQPVALTGPLLAQVGRAHHS